VLSIFDQHVALLPEPPSAPLNLRCSDPDDQVFLELALAHGATWLLSHDRALLRLARRTRALGLHIVKPGDWQPGPGPVDATPTPE
jgi:predicted nucleic acid-binding protein